MCPVVRETREVQLRLNIDLDAFILQFLLHRALLRARALPSVKLDLSDFVILFCQRRGSPRERQPGLRIVRPRASAPHAICFQPARNFSPPFGLSATDSIGLVVRGGRTVRNLWRGHTYACGLGILAALGERCVTEAAIFDVLEQEGAALPAYLYHWSVLRCGIPVTEHRHGSTQPAPRTPCPPPNAANVAYQATHKHRSRSE